MELLVNDLSLHRQFHDISSFREALGRLMAMREVARRFGREIHCYRAMSWAEAIPGVPMQQALSRLTESERRSATLWFTKLGPFWDELRQHGANDWLECRGEIVTESAVGEAAYKVLHDVECGLAGFTPSDWSFSPIEVTWRHDAEGLADQKAMLDNWMDAIVLEAELRDAAPPIKSWNDLRNVSVNQFSSLLFADDCFKPLSGVPFAKSSGERIRVLLGILDRSVRAFDAEGRRTPEGQQMYQDYFRGDNALFSDSSDTEKNRFQKELTFPHPDGSKGPLFCTWHGKERSRNLRLHYWWSGKADDQVIVVYVGPKITKQ